MTMAPVQRASRGLGAVAEAEDSFAIHYVAPWDLVISNLYFLVFQLGGPTATLYRPLSISQSSGRKNTFRGR